MNNFRILAGPIVRRASTKGVFFWIATNSPVRASAKIYLVPDSYEYGDSLQIFDVASDEQAGTRSVCLGEHLFVTLIAARPENGTLPLDQLLAYDLNLNGRSLADFGLLTGPKRITYGNLPLPSFFIPKEINTLFHGSCRNLGGSGLDALPGGDAILEAHPRDLSLRPSILILDGDQIYADYLPVPLIHHLTQLGNELMGWEESIPGIVPRLIELPMNGRQKLATEKAGFTSFGAQNQLMAFGEFAALYLLAWNEENWPDKLPSLPQKGDQDKNSFIEKIIGTFKGSRSPVEKSSQRDYAKAVKNLETVRKSVPAVRRLFANIPTYMMFDDHDVTDDFLITREWKRNVWDRETGRRIVANGLATVWAFQCWGNDPDRFPEEFIAAVTNHLHDEADDENLGKIFDETLWNFPDWTTSLPVHPTTVLLNTRTQRGYDSDRGAARLMNQDALEAMRWAAMRAGYQRGDPLILVSPAPVIGYETVEGMQSQVSRYIGPYAFDLEPWRANLEGYKTFFKFIITELAPEYVIFLSGDVHYGFTISASFTWKGKTLPVIQLTSSALKNSGIALEVIGLSTLFAGRTDQHFGWEKLIGDVEPEELTSEQFTEIKGGAEKQSGTRSGRSIHIRPGEDAPLPAKFSHSAGVISNEGAVKEKIEWKDSRTFEPSWGFRSLPIVGENNLGLVRFQNGNLFVHRLLIPTEMGTRSSTALVANTPGEVVLEKILSNPV